MPRHRTLVDISHRIMKRFQQLDLQVAEEFVIFAVHLLARDQRRGLLKYDLNKPTACAIESFVNTIVDSYVNPMDCTMANMRMAWVMKKGVTIDLEYVKKQYEEKFQTELQVLIKDILQYPETCNKVQLDQLFAKMQVFVVACYNLGSPKNHVLLKLTAQALNSVIGRSDLQNYVLKKKYHRLEYLQRLASTVAGIVIYNNDGPDGDRENVRSVVDDLEMAQKNTEAAFSASMERAVKMRSICQAALDDLVKIDHKDETLTYRVPLEHLDRLNQLSLTYFMQHRCLTTLSEHYHSTVYLIEVEQKRYNCVVAKINDTLSMRTAIDSELVFPHFVYISQVWGNLNNFLNHIVELNKLREQVEALVVDDLMNLVKTTIAELQALHKRIKKPKVCTFEERMDAVKDLQTDGNFCNLKTADIKEFCCLAMTVTNGLLMPAQITRKLCSNVDITFGFRDARYARFAELRFEPFIDAFRKVVFNSANLALLFKLDDALIAQELQGLIVEPPKKKDFKCQTEMVVTNDLSPSNWINVTWNAWDYHRETIHLANIRKKQTSDMQTKISYGQRNAQNQTYNTRQHL
ncbi:LOW QUALITY PROTEIN: cilia- and flagella-associated protein 206 [Drosophila gunungcola]|uniref:LOW QUALITY PROTEIN: cilia- and flagella-associated protein 206 n=1 Tax=Drosophila gunungcola TaxID=103775 RepID=UPI0022E6A3DB|nr:LOW QUALITY PROTEIN: cilia- and flagella-associated protein 206 [Drosophila gunungcola]